MSREATAEEKMYLEKLRAERQKAGEHYEDMRRIAFDFEAPMVQEARHKFERASLAWMAYQDELEGVYG